MNKKPKVHAISSLFQKLKDSNEFTPVPAVYGTPLWSKAVIAALGSAAKISTKDRNVKINFPGEKAITLSFEEFWEISCLSSCSTHNSLYLGNNADFWNHEKPWQALQEYNLMHCRAQLTAIQVKYLQKLITALQENNLPVPQVAGLAFGWAWMFEKSMGVWPPAEVINPRSCLYDPILGILSFQDIYDYLLGEKLPARKIWAHELSLCMATHCVQSDQISYMQKADKIMQDNSQEFIHNLVLALSAPLSVYNCDLMFLLRQQNENEVKVILYIILLAWKLLTAAKIPSQVKLTAEQQEFFDTQVIL